MVQVIGKGWNRLRCQQLLKGQERGGQLEVHLHAGKVVNVSRDKCMIRVGIGGTHSAIFLIPYSVHDQLVMEGRDFIVVVGNLTVWLLYSRGYYFYYVLIRFGIHPF
jgi:hypothetical protein